MEYGGEREWEGKGGVRNAKREKEIKREKKQKETRDEG